MLLTNDARVASDSSHEVLTQGHGGRGAGGCREEPSGRWFAVGVQFRSVWIRRPCGGEK